MKKNVKVIIIHGSYGSPEGNWFPWLSKELEARGLESVRPKLPTPEGQKLQNWLKEFKIQVGAINSNSILVGHSLSPAFILHLLQSLDHSIFGTFLVVPFIRLLNLPEIDEVNITIVKGPIDWNKIKKNMGTIKIYASDNDPYVPFEAVRDIADKLGVDITLIKRAGHINESSGYTEFPLIRDDILSLISS